MARAAQAISEPMDEEEGAQRGTEERTESEPAYQSMRRPSRPMGRRRLGTVLACGLLVSALGAAAWVSFAPRRESQSDRGVLALPQPVSAGIEVSTAGHPVGLQADMGSAVLAHGASAASGVARVDRASEPAGAGTMSPVGTDAASASALSRTEGTAVAQPGEDQAAIVRRLEEIEASLHSLGAAIDAMRAASAQQTALDSRSAAVPDARRTDAVHTARMSRKQPPSRLGRSTNIDSHRPASREAASEGPGGRSILTGWEIVGLSMHNVALRDPAGRTHVVAVGDSIVDDVEVTQIDTGAGRIRTTVGDLTYRAGAANAGQQ